MIDRLASQNVGPIPFSTSFGLPSKDWHERYKGTRDAEELFKAMKTDDRVSL